MTNTTQHKKNYLQYMRIRRFRSIVDMEVDFAPITIFVGTNDSGKSNILKAVNLLFNNEVEYASPYEYSRDYFKNENTEKEYPKSVGLTARIKSFKRKKQETVVASKYWKEEGFSTRDSKVRVESNTGKSRDTPKWYDRLKYRYVPANKGDEYMKILMRELYNQFPANIKYHVHQDTEGFVEGIRKETSKISDEIKDKLGLDSRIQLPRDISTLFELFDFETNNNILLKQRGDGIRVRHIPAILNFLADPKNQPKSRPDRTIWGYEEPENNLELMAAFKQAQQFVKYSSNVQILITTHSPAFYQMIAEDNCKGYYVEKDENNTTQIRAITKDNINHVNEGMGLMPLVAPYIREKQIEIDQIDKLLRSYEKSTIDKLMIVVEGAFDKAVLQYCITKLFSVDIHIHIARGGDRVGQLIKARCLTGRKYKNNYIGLLDKDNKGHKIKKTYPECGSGLMLLKMPKHIYSEVQKKHIGEVAINLESFLPLHYWEEAKDENLLEFSSFFNAGVKASFSTDEKTLEDAKKLYPKVWLYICYKVKRESKIQFRKLVMRKLEEAEKLPPVLEAEVKRIVEFLQSKQNLSKEKG